MRRPIHHILLDSSVWLSPGVNAVPEEVQHAFVPRHAGQFCRRGGSHHWRTLIVPVILGLLLLLSVVLHLGGQAVTWQSWRCGTSGCSQQDISYNSGLCIYHIVPISWPMILDQVISRYLCIYTCSIFSHDKQLY